MKLAAILLVVSDMERSRRFYEDVLLQKIFADFGENIMFESGISLQTRESWSNISEIPEERICACGNDAEVYFEDDDLDLILAHLKSFSGNHENEVRFVHDVKEHPWGQRVIRVYDPDGHIIEIGESMESVVMKFLASGMSIEDAAEKSQYPEEFVKECFIKLYAPKK